MRDARTDGRVIGRPAGTVPTVFERVVGEVGALLIRAASA